jgi:hypothetical protein
MKKIVLSLVAIVMIVCLSSNVMAQALATATGVNNATAKILTTITISQTHILNFGTMSLPTPSTGDATVLLTAGGTRTTPTANITLLAQAPVSAPGAYTVGGDANATYVITLPPTSVTLTGPGGWSLSADNFSCSYAGLNSTLNGSGADNFTVGALLHVPNPIVAGTFTGSFDVTVAYN